MLLNLVQRLLKNRVAEPKPVLKIGDDSQYSSKRKFKILYYGELLVYAMTNNKTSHYCDVTKVMLINT